MGKFVEALDKLRESVKYSENFLTSVGDSDDAPYAFRDLLESAQAVLASFCYTRRDGRLRGIHDPVELERRKYITEKAQVVLYRTDETGEWMWAVEVDDPNGFLLNMFHRHDKAVKYCKRLGLPIKECHE